MMAVSIILVCIAAVFFAHFNVSDFFTHDEEER